MKAQTLLIAAMTALTGCGSFHKGELRETAPGLLAMARFTPEDARGKALWWLPGSTIERAEIKDVDGRLWYEFDMDLSDGQTLIRIDAMNGDLYSLATEQKRDGLWELATLSDEQARKVALDRVRGGHIVRGELEERGGRLLYSYDIVVPGETGIFELQLDAANGAIVAEDRDSW